MRVTRSCRGIATATLTLALLGLPAATAVGQDQGTAELFPNPARPGDAVAVNTADCAGDDRASGDATAVGGGTFGLEPSTHPEVLVGQFTVPTSAEAGDYPVSVSCASGNRATGTLRVVQSDSTTTPTPTGTQTTQPTATATPTSPSGGVSGGVGNMSDNRVPVMAGSAATLFAAGAGAVWVLRRRNASDRG